MEEYRYNLVLFKEIKRFWQYREQLGWYAMFTNLFGNVIIFMPFGFFLPMASKYRSFFAAVFYQFYTEPVRGDISVVDEGGKF